MVIVEKSFPRGGVTTKETKPEGTKENIIFGAFQKKTTRSKSKVNDNLTKSLEETTKEDPIETISAELLNYDTIQDGMNIMGMVKAVDQLYISISLPGRLKARVSALEISDGYTKATKEFLQNTESTENYKPLMDLYHIGQVVYGRVQEVKQNEHGYTEINMSLKPSEVHSELVHVNIKKGFVFNGAIEEVQEHGYIIESGIKGLRAFLPIEKSKPGHTVGQLIFLKIERMTPDKSVSTCICKEIKPENVKIKNQIDPNIDYILPSTIVQFKVTKRLKDGLQGQIMNEAFTAYINEHQLAEPLALPEDYEVNATLNARILYVMPLTKLVYLTLNLRNPDAATYTGGDGASTAAEHFKRGDIIENAKVHHLGTGGVILILNNKFKGVISYKAIKAFYKGNYDQDQVLIKYAKQSKHKVRILDYDLMDSLYICTDDANTVNEKTFALDDLKPGEFVTAVVQERNAKVGGYCMQVGKVKGIIENLFLAPTTKTLEDKSKIRCRVVAVDFERKMVYLTNRAEYLAKNCMVLTSLTNAKSKAICTGTIVKCHDDYFLVKFFNHLKGVLHKQRLTGIMATEIATFYEGQTMPFRILNRNAEQITLTLADDIFSMGEICPVTIVHKLESGLEIEIEYSSHEDDKEEDGDDDDNSPTSTKGLIPLRLLSDFADLLSAKLHALPVDTKTTAVCMVKNIFSLRDVEYFLPNLTNDWQSVMPGDILKASVKNVTEDVVELMVPIRNYSKLVKVHLKMLLVTAFKNPNIIFAPEQVIYVKVLSKEQTTKTITVSAKLTDVWNGDLNGTALFLESYLKEVAEIKKSFKKQGNPIKQYVIGGKVKANFDYVNTDTNDWHYTLVKTNLSAVVRSSIIGKSKIPKAGEQQECIVLWIDYSNELIYLSNKSVDMTHITNAKELPTNLVGKSGINAKVLLKLENVFICSLKKGSNPLVFCPTRLHFNDFECSASINVNEGDFCKLTFIHGVTPIAVLENIWKLWQDITRKRKAQEILETSKPKKVKLEKKVETENRVEQQNVAKTNKKQKPNDISELPKKNGIAKKRKKENVETLKQNTAPLFYEDKSSQQTEVVKSNNIGPETELKTPKTNLSLPGITDFWNADLTQLNPNADGNLTSDDEDMANDENDGKAQKKKKLSTAEKFKQQREEETRLRTIEEKYADPKQLPESVDQFDRLVLSEPNDSKNWINYMVFHLQSAELDKARAIARRAIKAISFRDGNEQLNVWMALLNLELRYGTKETFDDTLKEALTYNEPLKIYLRTVEILGDVGKKQELIDMIGVITKKFKGEQEVWKTAANAYFSIGIEDRAQQMLHKALACLPERDHVNTIVAFANLNHKYNNNERAQTLLDQIVTSYPKRVDVWAQYVDMLVKEAQIDSARLVLERAIIQKIPLKKMRTIFKKYLEFEERFGSDADVQKVKKLATEYVKQNAHL